MIAKNGKKMYFFRIKIRLFTRIKKKTKRKFDKSSKSNETFEQSIIWKVRTDCEAASPLTRLKYA